MCGLRTQGHEVPEHVCILNITLTVTRELLEKFEKEVEVKEEEGVEVEEVEEKEHKNQLLVYIP